MVYVTKKMKKLMELQAEAVAKGEVPPETLEEIESLEDLIKGSTKAKDPKIPEGFQIPVLLVNKEITAAGLMNGAGAGLIGAIQAGFTPKYLIDNRKFISFKTWDWNFSPYNVLFSQKWESYRDIPIDLIIGSPSCAKFSRMGKKEVDGLPLDAADPEVFEYVNFLKEIMVRRPRFFILENVVGVRNYLWFDELESGEGSILRSERFDTGVVFKDYNLQEEILDTSSFGLAQYRKRLYIIGSLKEYNFNYKPPVKRISVSAQEVLKDLESQSSFYTVPNHEPPEHDEDRIQHFKELRPGESYYGTVNNKRITANYPTPTVTGGASRMVHYSEPRIVTPRECARLQGFPDHFIFFGGILQQYDQVGKGLSPTIIRHIADQVLKILVSKGQVTIPDEFKPKKRWLPRIKISIERDKYL